MRLHISSKARSSLREYWYWSMGFFHIYFITCSSLIFLFLIFIVVVTRLFILISIIINKKNDSPNIVSDDLVFFKNAFSIEQCSHFKARRAVLTNQLRISTNQKTVNYKSRVLHDLDLYNQPQSIFFSYSRVICHRLLSKGIRMWKQYNMARTDFICGRVASFLWYLHRII